jgi:DNA adenine methylase
VSQETCRVERSPVPVVNVASVPHRSPFRYPGGKTWLVPRIRQWLSSQSKPVNELIEPFAGGGIVSLTAVFEGLVRRATLVELDADIAAVWHTILNGSGSGLAAEIAAFELSAESVQAALAVAEESPEQRAFATLLRNRVSRGGILAPGAGLIQQGENGRGLASRWYPQTLRKRILRIVALSDRFQFIKGDGLEVMKVNATRPDVVFFIDPPYPRAGRRLYRHSEMDHAALFDLASGVSGDFLMTYDDSEEIQQLAARHGFDTRLVAMKNTHHTRKLELLISRDLGWLQE